LTYKGSEKINRTLVMKNKILSNSILFVIFEILNKSIPFLMLPILTRYLTPFDYGIVSSFTVYNAFFSIIIGLSAHGAIEANYFNFGKEKIAQYIFNILLVLIATLFFALIIVLVFNKQIEDYMHIKLEWQVIGVFVAVSQFITLINLTTWILEKNPKLYGIYQICQTITIVSLALVLIIGFDFNWRGQLIAISFGTILFAVISIILLFYRKYIIIDFNKNYLKDFLKYGIPMIPHQLSNFIKGQGDKLLLITILGVSATGYFTVGHQIGLIMGIFVASLHKAYYPVLFKKLSGSLDLNSKREIVKYTYIFFILLMVFAILLNTIISSIYPHIVGVEFQGSILLTQLIVISFLFDGFYYAVSAYIFYTKETAKLALITFPISIVHILLSYLFINNYGYIGVGYVLVISYTIQFFAVWYLSNKVYPMPWFSFWRSNV